MEYGNPVYGAASQNSLDKLQRTQSKALKSIHKLPKMTPTDKLHNLTKIDTLHYRRTRTMLIHAYHAHTAPDNLDLRNIRIRRHEVPMLKIKPYTKTMSQKAYCYRRSVAWNTLPVETRNAENLVTFSKQIALSTNLKNQNPTPS